MSYFTKKENLISTQDKDDRLSRGDHQILDLKKNAANPSDTDIPFQQEIKEEENQRPENFMLCIQSYANAIDLLSTYLSDQEKPQVAELKLIGEAHIKKIKQIEQIEQSEDKKFNQQKQIFYDFLSQCTEYFEKHTCLPDDALTKAKNFAVLKHGTQPINTEIKLDDLFDSSSKKITDVWQNDKPVVDEKLLPRLCQDVTENTRLWVEIIGQWEKETIKNLDPGTTQQLDTNPETIQKSEVHPYIIPSSLRYTPGLANLFLHRLTINDEQENPIQLIEFFRHATQVPISLLLVKKPDIDKEILAITCENIASQIRLSLQYREAKPTKNQEFVILTQSIVSPGFAVIIKSLLFSDRSDNDTLIYDTKEKAVELFQYALEHTEEEIKNEDILLTFFNSSTPGTPPYTYRQWLEKLNIVLPKQEDPSSSLKIQLLSTNHPYNLLRYLWTYFAQTKRNKLNTAKLFGCVERYLSGSLTQNSGANENVLSELATQLQEAEKAVISEDKKIKIKKTIEIITSKIKQGAIQVKNKNTLRLLEALRAYLTIPPGQGSLWQGQRDTRHRQSMISALEVIIVDCLEGVPWIACKSGKDRTGGASATIDAMALFYEKYRRFPFYNDDQAERNDYLLFLAELLQSGHHQKVASCNAPGAKGLINENSFLPSDMKFDHDRIKTDTEFARLNKPRVKSTYKNLNKKIKNFIKKESNHLKKHIDKLFYETKCLLQEAINKKIEDFSTETLKYQKDNEKNYSKIEDASTLTPHTSSSKNIDIHSNEMLPKSIGEYRVKRLRPRNYFIFSKLPKIQPKESEDEKMKTHLLSKEDEFSRPKINSFSI